MGGGEPLVLLQRAEDGLVLVGRRLPRRGRAGPQDPGPSRRDPAEVGGSRRGVILPGTRGLLNPSFVAMPFFQGCVLR